MKQYVLMNKKTGKFVPHECALEDATVFTSENVDYDSPREKLIEVYTEQTIQLLTSWKYEFQKYVVMDYISGEFLTKANSSSDLQEAFIFTSTQSYAKSALYIPVIEHRVVEIV